MKAPVVSLKPDEGYPRDLQVACRLVQRPLWFIVDLNGTPPLICCSDNFHHWMLVSVQAYI